MRIMIFSLTAEYSKIVQLWNTLQNISDKIKDLKSNQVLKTVFWYTPSSMQNVFIITSQ